MSVSLKQIMLFAHDVEALAAFYQDSFGFLRREHIENEWVVLAAGSTELALHRVGPAWRHLSAQGEKRVTNTKLVFSVSTDLVVLRQELMDRGIKMGEIKNWPDGPGPLCDGHDPEGNVFQLVQDT